LGTRKRLELGRALAMEPRLLLLDEPFAGAGREDVSLMAAAVRRVSEAGTALMVIDHDLDAVLGDLSHRVVVLDAGRVVAAAAPQAVRVHPAVAEAYLGHGRRDPRPVSAS
jgi:branched-chain amino acid transport system ATP-binding protein